MERPQEDHELAAAYGEAVARFTNDPTIKQVFREMELLYFTQWKASQDVGERERIHAKASALSDLETALRAVVDAGTLATQKLQRDK